MPVCFQRRNRVLRMCSIVLWPQRQNLARSCILAAAIECRMLVVIDGFSDDDPFKRIRGNDDGVETAAFRIKTSLDETVS